MGNRFSLERLSLEQFYVGCVVDGHLALNEMVEDKAARGRRTLGAWLHCYQQEVGDIGVGTLRPKVSLMMEMESCL